MSQRFAVLVLVRLLFLPLAVAASVAAAQQPTVSTDRNIYSAGGQVRPDGPVAGDFVAGGGRVIVDQTVGGDVSAAGGTVDIRAAVAEDVRAMGGDIVIDSSVGGDLMATGGSVTIGGQGKVAGSARVFAGKVVLEGSVGSLKAKAERIRILGEVAGDADLEAEHIELGPQARIGGALTYESPNVVTQAEGATIGGAVTHRPAEPSKRSRRSGTVSKPLPPPEPPSLLASVLSLLGLLALTGLFVLVAPTFSTLAADRVRVTPWSAMGIGVLALFLVPPVALLLVLTILGIPVAFVLLVAYALLLFVGFLVGVVFVGRLLPRLFQLPSAEKLRANIGYAAVGLVLLLLVWRVPVVGPFLVIMLTLGGAGALLMELRSLWTKGVTPPAPPAALTATQS